MITHFVLEVFMLLRKNILKRTNLAALNFHPCSHLNIEVWSCVDYALFDEVKKYGCTAHIMNKQR